MWRRVALVKIDDSEERAVSIFRVGRICGSTSLKVALFSVRMFPK
jgi:hypothetical protein